MAIIRPKCFYILFSLINRYDLWLWFVVSLAFVLSSRRSLLRVCAHPDKCVTVNHFGCKCSTHSSEITRVVASPVYARNPTRRECDATDELMSSSRVSLQSFGVYFLIFSSVIKFLLPFITLFSYVATMWHRDYYRRLTIWTFFFLRFYPVEYVVLDEIPLLITFVFTRPLRLHACVML